MYAAGGIRAAGLRSHPGNNCNVLSMGGFISHQMGIDIAEAYLIQISAAGTVVAQLPGISQAGGGRTGSR